MTQPPADALLFEVPPPPTPTERLLALAGRYTHHNDTLDLLLAESTEPDPDSHVEAAQGLATETLAAIKAIYDERLYESAELSDAIARLKQLAYLSTASAGHGPQLARELTALAPEAVLDSATRVAGEIRRRRWSNATPPDESLSAAQHTALHEIARGHVVVTGSADRQYVHHRTARVLISTVRSLEAKDLVARKAKSASPAYIGGPPQDRVHLTPAGVTVLATVLALPPATTAGPSPRPAPRTQTATRGR
ncbi:MULTISPECIES: hypothetical protein [unclassified Streptomyces]|uniref:hypothetical protein n=1 Tax=unclassified Streptomyces TaxID=2593676 RepID=UPI000823F3EF|nr:MULTISPECIES: hypothetical protein [unclassified Streptomyces]MYT96636.1 hypothetical protein [Streptomyces sp. SID8350]SCK54371.1 hypothetical protein YUWDRAFT_04840 [Streptomyces sp. AmelKG-D3]